VGIIRGIEKNQIEGRRRGRSQPRQGIGMNDFDLALRAKGSAAGLQGLSDAGGALNHDHLGGASGSGLETQRAAPGKKIQAPTALNQGG
jgi:hypothetical protein